MRRIKAISIFFLAVFVALTLRLGYIQILGYEELSAATRTQSLIALEGSNTRGIIYDRNGVPLVADEKHYIYIIKDSDFTKDAKTLLEKADAEIVSSDNEGYQVYSSKRYDKSIGNRLAEENNAYILQASARYGMHQSASHFIGYINKGDLRGATGLELMYDEKLSGLNRRVYAAADVKGNLLTGRGLIIASDEGRDSYVADGIRTTLDKELQTEIEKIIGEMENDCAVVVLDSKTGGITAMACSPKFDPNDVYEIISENDVDDDVLVNKATQGEYSPGSVFKIVTAAAALENGIDTDRTYYCSGHAELDGLTIKCDTGGKSGHGYIGFEEAMSKSCNSYFIQLGKDIGADKIVDMAEKMGMGKEVMNGYPHESPGHLMTEAERSGNAIGNLSIGQGETLVTPIQVAAATNIIANGGIDKGIHLLMSGEEKDIRDSEKITNDQVITEETAKIINDMMQSVCESGTGSSLELVADNGEAKVSIKTGTAEYTAVDGMHSHGWITGFTPCEEPEYVITVFVEDGGSGAASAGPVLKRIIEYLEKSGDYSMPTFA